MLDGKTWSCLLTVFLAATVAAPLHAADQQVHVVPFSRLKHWWRVPANHPDNPPRYPAAAVKNDVEGCITVAFLIRSDGSTTAPRVWRTGLPRWDTAMRKVRKMMEQSLLRAVRKWHFVAAPTNARHAPVYTYEVVTYDISGSTGPDKYRDRELDASCKVTNFRQQVAAMVKAGRAEHKP